MKIYPAIDISKGKCVRLLQGVRKNETIYGDDPLEMAYKWKSLGAKRLHIVDLDGAFDGESMNAAIISTIIKNVGIPVQIGGGLRSLDKVKSLLDIGVNKAILGTAAIEDPSFVAKAVLEFGDKIAIGIDAKNGKVAIKGWTEESEVLAFDLALKMKEIGVKTVIYTDIAKDGMLSGPNFEMTAQIAQIKDIKVIASGGISAIDDVLQLKELNIYGVIVGKALYNGNIDLEKLMKVEDM